LADDRECAFGDKADIERQPFIAAFDPEKIDGLTNRAD
jgi:hypothetical protein